MRGLAPGRLGKIVTKFVFHVFSQKSLLIRSLPNLVCVGYIFRGRRRRPNQLCKLLFQSFRDFDFVESNFGIFHRNEVYRVAVNTMPTARTVKCEPHYSQQENVIILLTLSHRLPS